MNKLLHPLKETKYKSEGIANRSKWKPNGRPIEEEDEHEYGAARGVGRPGEAKTAESSEARRAERRGDERRPERGEVLVRPDQVAGVFWSFRLGTNSEKKKCCEENKLGIRLELRN